MLKLKNLTISIGDHVILEDINLEVNPGEIHAVMGPKYSGKTDLAFSITGNPNFEIKEGSITYKKKSLTNKSIDQRNHLGIYTSFQHLPSINGVSNFELLLTALSYRNDGITLTEIESHYKELCKHLGLSSDHKNKAINDESMTLSECRKTELLHMTFLNPDLSIIDEIDEGVEDEELILVGNYLKEFHNDKEKSAIIITNNKDFLDILEPHYVHVMFEGRIQQSGTTELYKRIIKDGYPQFS